MRNTIRIFLAISWRITTVVPILVGQLSASEGNLEIRYDLPRAGKVSLAVYDQRDHQVRTLLAGEPQEAGKHLLRWDGLDRAGNAMPMGNYQWKLLMNDGLKADYLTLVGQNPIDPAKPWEPTVGSHQGPSSVVIGHDGSLYHGSRNSEGPPVLMKLDSEAGPIRWVRDWQTKGPVSMVEIGESLYVLGWNAELQRVNTATGINQGKPIDLLWPGDVRSGIDDPVSSYAIKIAADGDKLIVAYRDHNLLRWIDPATGNVLREVALPQPRGAVVGDGVVYGLSGNSVVAISADGKVSTIIAPGTLAAPTAFDFDRINKQLVVADGAEDQRVRRFTTDGKPLATYGRMGGRLDGAHVPTDFRDVSYVTCDSTGGFYAVESDHLRRIVHIAADGTVAKQWLGGVPFFAVTSVDSAAPNELWYVASYTTMAVANLDLQTGAWTITHTYSMPEKGFGDGLFPSVGAFPVWRVRHHAGGTYLIHESPAALLRVDEKGRRLVPVALASHKKWGAERFENAAINAAMAKQGFSYDDLGSDAFSWSDNNGNGELDAEEFRFHNQAAPMHGRFCTFDDQLNIYLGYSQATNYTYTGKRWLLFDFQQSAYAKLPNLAAAGSATPVWDWSKLELSASKMPSDLVAESAIAARWDPRGGVTLALRGEVGNDADRHGLVWPDGQQGATHLLRTMPDGTSWTVSKHDSPGMPAATVLRCPGYFPGHTHGCIIASDRNYYGATAWTEDGLFAGFFLDRHADDLPDWAYDPRGRGLHGLLAGDDWECAGSLADLPDGSVLWIPRSSGRSAVFQVTGWENWFRDHGKIEINEPRPAAIPDGKGLVGTYYRGKDFAEPPVASQVDARLWFRNGSSNERIMSWSAGPCKGIAATEPFSVRWTGRLEAPLGEDYWFRIYNENHKSSFVESQWWRDGAGFGRLWLNGVLVIDRSEGVAPSRPFEAGPIRLEAGRSYEIKVEYASPGVTQPEFSLAWASNTKQWERVPPAYLHADPPPPAPVVHVLAENPSTSSPTARFALDHPLSEPLTLRYRTIGTDYVPHTDEVTIAAGSLSSTVTLVTDTGPMKLMLEPDAAYHGDGTREAEAVTLGSIPSVTKGLGACYLLDEATGDVAHDSAGGFDTTFEVFMRPPIPRWLPSRGKRGGALEFSEPGTSLSLPVPNISGDFTVACWIRTKKATEPLVLGSFDLWLEDGRPKLIFAGWPSTIKDGPRLDDGQWHHLVIAWDQSGGKRAVHFYIDGLDSGNAFGPAEGSVNRLQIGLSNSAPARDFLGAIDELRIYQRCLAPEEIAQLAHPPAESLK